MSDNAKHELAVKNTATGGAKSAVQVVGSFLKAAFETPTRGYFTEGHMLKAKCPRLAGRSTVLGNTVFAFDKDGVCSVLDQGNARVDYELLLQQNGVQKFEESAPVIKAESLPLKDARVFTPDPPAEEVAEEKADEPAEEKPVESKKKKSIFGK